MQINEKKHQRQILGQQRWRHSGTQGLSQQNGWGTWEWVTGMGKTFAAIDMAAKMVNSNSAFTFIIVVPGPKIQEQWREEIKRIIAEEHQGRFDVFTIHKIMEDYSNNVLYDCTLLILDEIHEYLSDDRIKVCYGAVIRTQWCLGLTANYYDPHKRHHLIQTILPVVDRIDNEEALREGFISKFIEYNWGVSLTKAEQDMYDIASEKMTKSLSKLGRNSLETANKILKGVSAKDYSLIFQIAHTNGWRKDLNRMDPRQADIDDMWAPAKIIGYASNGLVAVRERKQVIYNAINKLEAALQVVKKFDTLKFICFSQTTLFADSLAKRINEYYEQTNPSLGEVCKVYHSAIKTQVIEEGGKSKKKGKTVLKREAIESLESGKCRGLSTASALDRGLNVEELELSITTSGTQNPNQHNQRRGRSLRKLVVRDKTSLIINIYAKNTQDERWLRSRQSKSNNIVYNVDKVEDISYDPTSKETFNIEKI